MSQIAAKSRTRRNRQASGRLTAGYLAMIHSFPLRPLRSEREYDAALSVLNSLAVRPEGSLDPGEQDYFDTLTMLVEAYDQEHYHDHVIGRHTRNPMKSLRLCRAFQSRTAERQRRA